MNDYKKPRFFFIYLQIFSDYSLVKISGFSYLNFYGFQISIFN